MVPKGISRLIWGFLSPASCPNQFTSNKVRFRFTHIGDMIGKEIPEDINLDNLNTSPLKQQQIVLSKYGGEAEFTIVDEDFEGNE